MKKISNYLLLFALTAIAFTSCTSESFDETLLLGKWSRQFVDTDGKTKTDIYRYDVGGMGVSWVPEDDITEAEAQAFSWKLENTDLTHIQIMETGAAGFPKIYTVTELTATTLKYKDSSNSYSFTKVVD